ncbi:hypothetical protein EDI_037860 [Entamoeba dispar SAW760]|uniref:BAP29/BAP31 transmembrane domain-containing protein n=1 Tax=Entamoeba dispar (strain ATCC PRA-260 / SAW760) TaxID=370354 RepID=B0ERI9_ENTDS|nr:uncharacterized protein EDI_037860 [Entamoeba dispar SAW760]XP_001741156.1 uncharacterized protein EDI_343110 [Entamoeba dispar SAW760]EDR22379.1 hypothetical protein EDI_343110 [Entamoeba dispar SAW760]EDR22847.1 hypothetical protein EDI_037860 [Entamoeba dispar SAW760]|eukprot:EDR22379.1 hypothetical protein EDI_343110 [Entamoeba dispar SAW760]
MASILYTLNFAICVILIITLILLLIPIPNIVKKQILNLSHWIIKKRIFSITLLVIVFILFVDAFSRMKHYEGIKQSLAFDAPINTRISTYSELFRSQRNTYITFFNLFLVLVNWRVGAMVRKVIN